MKRIPTNVKFWLACMIIVIASFLQTAYSWFPGTLLIVLAVACCIWQFHRKVQQMKNFIAKEKNMRVAADRYIHARFPKS